VLTFTLSAGTTSGTIVVTTPGGTTTSTTGLVRVAAPTITGFTPAMGPAGAPVAVSVFGANLTGATAVTVGGVAVAGFTVDVTGNLLFTLPIGSIGGVIVVTTPGGTATSTGSLILVQAPTITSFSPTTAPSSAPVTVTVTGTNLSSATNLTVGGLTIPGYTVNSVAGTLTFTLPASSAGGFIVITTPSGTVTSATALNLVAPPSIASFTPATAPASTPVTVAVTGTNLTGATAVTVGGVAVTGFTVDANGVLTFTLPAGSTGGVITVTTPGGTATSATALTIVLGTRPAAGLPVQLYPNPAHGTVYLSRSDNNATTPLQALLYNSLGQLVHAATLPAHTTALDVSTLPPGIYTLRLRVGAAGSTHRLTLE
jgi:hypothetical protein